MTTTHTIWIDVMQGDRYVCQVAVRHSPLFRLDLDDVRTVPMAARGRPRPHAHRPPHHRRAGHTPEANDRHEMNERRRLQRLLGS